MDIRVEKAVPVPEDLTEFLAEMRRLERMHAQGLISRQEWSRAKRQALLTWLLANNPGLLGGGRPYRPHSHRMA